MFHTLCVPVPLQPWLLQKPHRFLRDPLLRSVPACNGGLDHTVHNRIRPDVWIRLPAGVEKEEEGGGGRSSIASWKEVALPSPCPEPTSSYQSDDVLGSACFFFFFFFWPSLRDRSKDLVKKKKWISQRGRACCCRANATPPPPLLQLVLLLLYVITVPPLLWHPSTSFLLPGLLDSALLPGRCGEERGQRTRGFWK